MRGRWFSSSVVAIVSCAATLLLDASSLAHASHALSMSPESGPPGAIVRISGQGYANQPCTVKFAGETVPVRDGKCATDGDGVADERFVVPSVARAATYDVEFWVGEGEFEERQDTFRFYVPPAPAITVTPTEGPPGTTVRATGSSFGSPCAVHLDEDQQAGPAGCDVTSNGTIDETFRIPDSAVVGDHSVRACSRCGRSGEEWARASFRVTEPSAPDEPTASDRPTSGQPASGQPTSEPPVSSDEAETAPPDTTSDADGSDRTTRPERPPLNRGPRAIDDSATTQAGTPVRIDVAANDRDPEGRLNPRSVRLTSRPRHGTAHLDQHVAVYEPDGGFVGDDLFTYRVCDDGGACDTARVSIAVLDPAALTSREAAPSEPDECPESSIGHLTVDPASGPAGTPVRIGITVDADEECVVGRLRLTLDGEPLGDPVDVEGDGASFDWLVPEGLPPGIHVIAVEDEASARSLGEAPFELLAATRRSPLLPTAATGALLLGGGSVAAIVKRRRRSARDPCAGHRKRVDDLRANVADLRRYAAASRKRAQEASAESRRLGHLQPPLREGPIRGIVVRTLNTAHGTTAREAAIRLGSAPRPLAHVVIGPDGVVPLLPDERVVRGMQAVNNPESASGGSDAETPDDSRKTTPEPVQEFGRGKPADLTPVGTGAGIDRSSLTLAIAGWDDSSQAEHVLRQAAAWCRERIRLHAIPVRHVGHQVGSAGFEGLVGEWELAAPGTRPHVDFPWNRLLRLIESTDDEQLATPLPTSPCQDIQHQADEARRQGARAEERAETAERKLRDAEQELDQARREFADECQ